MLRIGLVRGERGDRHRVEPGCRRVHRAVAHHPVQGLGSGHRAPAAARRRPRALRSRPRPRIRAPRSARSSGGPTPAGSVNEQIIAALRRDLGGSRVLAFANPKGGVHKTTATVLAAATIGGARGRGVVAWDDNELRGTLGPARRQRPARPDHPAPGHRAGRGRVAHRARPCSSGSTTSCGTPPTARTTCSPARRTRGSPGGSIRRPCAGCSSCSRRTHDVICVDTGNNVESGNWQTVMQTADQLVITTCRARTPRSPPTGCSTCWTRPA